MKDALTPQEKLLFRLLALDAEWWSEDCPGAMMRSGWFMELGEGPMVELSTKFVAAGWDEMTSYVREKVNSEPLAVEILTWLRRMKRHINAWLHENPLQ
jgi:hypothetical protein